MAVSRCWVLWRVQAGDGAAEAAGGEAGGELEYLVLASSAGQPAGVQAGDGGGPVDAGHFGGAVGDADAVVDEAAGEVLAVQEDVVCDR
jgi:hypothetical protein